MMLLFFVTFFVLYGMINLYFFLKLRAAFKPTQPVKLIAGLTLFMLTFVPALIRFFERQGHESLAISLSYVGYLWMAFIVLFFFFGIITDLIRVIFSLGKKIGILNPFAVPRGVIGIKGDKISFLLPLLVSTVLVIYGLIEASSLRVERVSIKTEKIHQNLRIVQISDVHLGLLIRERKLSKIASEIKRLSPDILVSTGDLVDGQIEHLDGLSEILRDISTRYGKFAVTGNHEFYRDIEKSLSFMSKAGFTVLRNQGVFIEELNLSIVGVDDPESVRFGHKAKVSENDLLSEFADKGFVLLLKHRPIVEAQSVGLFDLQLSGHTHKGQFFPFGLVTALYYEKHAGCLSKFNRCYLYTSRGAGTWGPPIRIFAPPEITLIELIRAD